MYFQCSFCGYLNEQTAAGPLTLRHCNICDEPLREQNTVTVRQLLLPFARQCTTCNRELLFNQMCSYCTALHSREDDMERGYQFFRFLRSVAAARQNTNMSSASLPSVVSFIPDAAAATTALLSVADGAAAPPVEQTVVWTPFSGLNLNPGFSFSVGSDTDLRRGLVQERNSDGYNFNFRNVELLLSGAAAAGAIDDANEDEEETIIMQHFLRHQQQHHQSADDVPLSSQARAELVRTPTVVPDEFVCSVCLTPSDSTTTPQHLLVLPCAHTFHTTCIDRWFMSHCTCPVCRSNLHRARPQ